MGALSLRPIGRSARNAPGIFARRRACAAGSAVGPLPGPPARWQLPGEPAFRRGGLRAAGAGRGSEAAIDAKGIGLAQPVEQVERAVRPCRAR